MDPTDAERRVLAEQVRMLYSNAPMTYRVSVVNACLVYGVLGLYLPQERMLAWLALVLTITLGRYVVVALYWRNDAPQDPRRWAQFVRLGAMLSGLAWGSLITVPGVGAPIWIQSFISFVIAGMSTAALISLSALRSIAVPHIILILLPLPITLAIHGDTPRLAMAVMATFFLLLLIRLAYRIYDIIESGIRLKQQNEEMFRIFEKASRPRP